MIRSRDNPLHVRLRKLVREGTAYRKLGLVWLEGDHLLRACLARGRAVQELVVSETAAHSDAVRSVMTQVPSCAVLSDALFKDLSELPSPQGLGGLVAWQSDLAPRPGVPSLVLDRLQDSGNVGSVLRSAAALGVQQVLALSGTAGLWSQKVLRAAMGAHFALHLCEGLSVAHLEGLGLAYLATDSHAGVALPEAVLPANAAFVLGHEGQGVSAELRALCSGSVRIAQPGGEESLNVAAAAAILLYEWSRQQISST